MQFLAATGLVFAFSLFANAAPAEGTGENKVVMLTIVNGTVANIGDTLRVKQGERLELRWSSDKPVELHLHGYDIQAKVDPAAPAVMAFTATIPGRFPIEVHGHGPRSRHPLLYLEVYP